MGFPLPVPKRWLSGQEGRSGAGLCHGGCCWEKPGLSLRNGCCWRSGCHLIQPSYSSRPQSWLPSTTSWLLLIISKDRNSTSSLGSLYHCSGTLTVEMCSLMYPGVQFVASPRPVLSLGTTGKSLTASSLHHPFRYFVHG